jgi:asparagine synthase (glutamine-hydrolysing)
MSQPVMEAGLRIASYLMPCDGQDRGLARFAFATDLPPQIVWRRNKGGATEHMRALLRYNLDFVRSLLLDGLLSQRGLLNRTALDGALSNDPTGSVEVMQVFHVLSAEARLRAWVS